MNTRHFFLFILSLIILGTASCSKKISKPSAPVAPVTQVKTKAGPPVIIYKTKKDYSNNIPVGLSPDKKELTSFPAITDIYYNGALAVPIRLNNGYLLDNRGIGTDVAFLSITYTEYSKLKNTPSADSLYSWIIDSDPLTEMFNCGSRYDYEDLVKELNLIIKNGEIRNFRKLK